jgi:alanine-glyoxylate transaminase / serine-glyoxylate transaminase / serine-pyruvate transaminase
MKLPIRTLMGPGPLDVHPRVLAAMSQPLLGHLDPVFLDMMNRMMDKLRYVFETKNELTLAMSGTGSAGMETVFVNLVEPGDKVIVGVNGLFGTRMMDVASRLGAEVIPIEQEWGLPIAPEQIERALTQNPDTKFVAIVHAETSTGVWQPIDEIAQVVNKFDALLIVDAVTSLGGIPVQVDEHKIDACYSGTQKCVGAPPGLAPVTLSPKAFDLLKQRKSKVPNWYLDLTMIANYWGQERFYHHTAPISMIYALYEALTLIEEEGLSNVYARHLMNGRALQAGLQAMGLEMVVKDERYRLPQLTAVRIPDGIQDTQVRSLLLERYGIEIGGGLGPFKGNVWRIGLMGYSSRRKNVLLFLSALEDILNELGYTRNRNQAVEVASKVYAEAIS